MFLITQHNHVYARYVRLSSQHKIIIQQHSVIYMVSLIYFKPYNCINERYLLRKMPFSFNAFMASSAIKTPCFLILNKIKSMNYTKMSKV